MDDAVAYLIIAGLAFLVIRVIVTIRKQAKTTCTWGCHWGKWERVDATLSDMTGRKFQRQMQARYCKLCNKKEVIDVL